MKKQLIGNVILKGIGKQFLANTVQSKKDHTDYILSNYYYVDIYNDFDNTSLQNQILNQYIDYFRQNKIMCDNCDLMQIENKLKTKNIELSKQRIADIIINIQYKNFFQNGYKTKQKKETLKYQQLLVCQYEKIKKIYIHPIFYKNHNQLFSKCKIPYRQFFLTYKNIPCVLDRTIQNKQQIYIVLL